MNFHAYEQTNTEVTSTVPVSGSTLPAICSMASSGTSSRQ
jgi:hypothetical protein